MKYERSSTKYLDGTIVIIYTFFSGFWILCSDRLLALLIHDLTLLTKLQMVKGWLFVLLTSGLLYGLVRWGMRSLQESHNLLQAIVEGTDDAIFVKDCAGRYVMLNSATAKHLEKSRSQILGQDDTTLFSPNIAREIRETDHNILSTGQTQSLEETVAINGSLRTYHSIKGVYRDAKQNIIGLIGIARDITERKRLVEELKRDKEDLAALSTVTANGISTLNLQELLDVMLERIVEVMQADAATIRLKKDDSLQICASIGIKNNDYI
ncbi:MAG: PAS domain-containing protein, partial [Microcoleus sp. SIO2G3]|nr:PAS domain-containing protein [Microcoleus sp. SIO2G3]